MLFVYLLLGVLTVGMVFMFTNFNRSMARLAKEHQNLRKEHFKLRVEYIELKQYCTSLETRVQYLERSRQLLSYIVKKANIRGTTVPDMKHNLHGRRIS